MLVSPWDSLASRSQGFQSLSEAENPPQGIDLALKDTVPEGIVHLRAANSIRWACFAAHTGLQHKRRHQKKHDVGQPVG